MSEPAAAVWRRAERARLFDEIPSAIFVLSPDLTVVDGNNAFTRMFGDGYGSPCYQITKGRDAECEECPARAAFEDGRYRVVEETGTDRMGRQVHYLVHMTPLKAEDGTTEFVAATMTDLTETRRLQREYQILFEKVP